MSVQIQRYQWFVEPLTDLTNEYISRELPAESAERGVMCQDGRKRNLWRCEWRFISNMLHSSLGRALKYTVFIRAGERGVVREASFISRRLSKRSKMLERVEFIL